MVIVVGGEGTSGLANEIAKGLGCSVAGVEFRMFPDGEEYARLLAAVDGQDVVVVQTTFPPARLWRLFLTLDACREAGAKSIKAIAPYLAYARQDRVFKPGEALSSRLVAQILSGLASQVFTVDAHKADIRAYYTSPFANVSADEPLAAEMKRLRVDVVLAPDAGAIARATSVAKRIGAQSDHLEKKRISSEIVEMTPKRLDVNGKSVCILDDIISTGGTMAKALEQLKRNGAREVHAACVHGLFQGDAVEELRRAGAKEIVATNTIESPYSRVSVADPILREMSARAAVPPRAGR